MSYEIIEEILEQDGDLTYLSKDGDGKNLVVRKFESLSEEEIDVLLNRASQLQQVVHPNISQVREVLASGKDYYLVEEIPFTTNLQEYIGKKKKITMTMASWIRDSLLSALSAVHPSIIHGEIRPENVWIDPENKTAVLSCFGVFEGDPVDHISSPEHHQGYQLTEVSDVFSLGAFFYYILTGVKLPNILKVKQGEMSFMPPRDHTGLEPEWNKFILQCLEIKKAKRFPDIKAIQTFFGGKVKMTPQSQQRRVSPESITRKQKD